MRIGRLGITCQHYLRCCL